MGKKRIQRLLLAAGLILTLGYVAHLGGCSTGKMMRYYNTLCKRKEQAADLAQRTYQKGEEIYNQAEPHLKHIFQEKEEKTISEEKKENDRKEKRKTLSAEVVIG